MSENASPQDAGAEPQRPSPMEALGALLDAEEAREQHRAIPGRQAEAAPQNDAPQGSDSQDDADGTQNADPDQPEEAKAQDDESSYVEIELNGKQYRVPQELKDGFLMQSDYTRKTQELAAQRREVEAHSRHVFETAKAMIEAAPQVRDAVAQLQAIDSQLMQYESLNWADIRARDPQQYAVLVADRQQLIDAKAKVQAQGADALNRYQHAEQQKRAVELHAGHQYLSQRIKGWGAELDSTLTNYALGLGIPESTLVGMVRTPQLVEALHKAWQFDRQQNAKPENKRLQPNTPTVKPGARPGQGSQASQSNRRRMFDRLTKTGSIRDAAALIEV